MRGPLGTFVTLCLVGACSLDSEPLDLSQRQSSPSATDGGSATSDGSADGKAGSGAGTGTSGSGGGGGSGAGSSASAGTVAAGDAGPDALVGNVDGATGDAATDAMMWTGTTPGGLATCQDFKVSDTDLAVCPPECTTCSLGVCTLSCATPAACATAKLQCPKGYGCLVQCSGPNSCATATVKCADGPCDVSCIGPNACTSMVVECGDDACRATCNGTNGVGLNLKSGSSCAPDGCP